MAKTILLADDSVTIQKVVELTFMDEDFEVEAVGSGNEAIDWLQGARPDLVIADVHMPGADGYAVCEHAKSHYADLPVLLLVGTFEPFDEGRATAAGADAHLKKPFDAQDLLGHVSRLTESTDDAEDATIASYRLPAEDLAPSDPAPFELDLPSTPAPPAAAAPAPPANDHATRIFQAHDATPPPAPTGVPLETVAIHTIAPEDVPPAPAEAVAFAEAAGTPVAVDDARDHTESMDEIEDREITAELDPRTVAAAVAEAGAQAAASSASAEPSQTADAHSNGHGNGALSDDDVERIARRVAELVGESAVRDVAWEVVPDLAEVVIKERIRELESQLE